MLETNVFNVQLAHVSEHTFYEYIICIYFMNVPHEYIKRIGIFYEYIMETESFWNHTD